MPRKPENNPTERIGEILSDIAELETWEDALIDILITNSLSYPPRPVPIAIIKERQRRELTLGTIRTARANMRRVRIRQSTGQHVRGHTEYHVDMDSDITSQLAEDPLLAEAGLTDETKAMLAKLIADESPPK